MGIFSRLTPKKTPEVLTKVAPSVFPPSKVADTITSTSDDEPTWFTTFITLYYGMFGITLLLYPKVWTTGFSLFGYGNPMAYWTSMSADLEFAFHMLGACFTTLVLGPFMDELFGGKGVNMKAYTEYMFIVNLFVWTIFVWYGFYAPLGNAVVWVWQATTYFASFIVAWNLMNVSNEKLPVYYARFLCFLYSGFGFSLVTMPEFFFGPPSPVAYWNTFGETGLLCGRSLGIGLIAVATLGFYYNTTASFLKQMFLFNVINLGLFVIPAFYGGSSAIQKMWEIQFVLQIAIVTIGLESEIIGGTGWKFSFSFSGCKNDIDTYNLVNFIWFIPFIGGFFSVPNYLFGPASPTGVPMFLADLNETALWFGKAWATCCLIIMLGPYVFHVKPITTAKQYTFCYLGFTALFIYALLQYEIMNPTMIIPLTVVNGLFFLWGFYLILPQTSSEPMF